MVLERIWLDCPIVVELVSVTKYHCLDMEILHFLIEKFLNEHIFLCPKTHTLQW
jgi:hypothetical protein